MSTKSRDSWLPRVIFEGFESVLAGWGDGGSEDEVLWSADGGIQEESDVAIEFGGINGSWGALPDFDASELAVKAAIQAFSSATNPLYVYTASLLQLPPTDLYDTAHWESLRLACFNEIRRQCMDRSMQGEIVMLQVARAAGTESDWRSTQAAQEIALGLASLILREEAISSGIIEGFRLPRVPGSAPAHSDSPEREGSLGSRRGRVGSVSGDESDSDGDGEGFGESAAPGRPPVDAAPAVPASGTQRARASSSSSSPSGVTATVDMLALACEAWRASARATAEAPPVASSRVILLACCLLAHSLEHADPGTPPPSIPIRASRVSPAQARTASPFILLEHLCEADAAAAEVADRLLARAKGSTTDSECKSSGLVRGACTEAAAGCASGSAPGDLDADASGTPPTPLPGPPLIPRLEWLRMWGKDRRLQPVLAACAEGTGLVAECKRLCRPWIEGTVRGSSDRGAGEGGMSVEGGYLASAAAGGVSAQSPYRIQPPGVVRGAAAVLLSLRLAGIGGPRPGYDAISAHGCDPGPGGMQGDGGCAWLVLPPDMEAIRAAGSGLADDSPLWDDRKAPLSAEALREQLLLGSEREWWIEKTAGGSRRPAAAVDDSDDRVRISLEKLMGAGTSY